MKALPHGYNNTLCDSPGMPRLTKLKVYLLVDSVFSLLFMWCVCPFTSSPAVDRQTRRELGQHCRTMVFIGTCDYNGIHWYL